MVDIMYSSRNPGGGGCVIGGKREPIGGKVTGGSTGKPVRWLVDMEGGVPVDPW